MEVKELTAQQEKVLRCVEEFSAAKGFPPTLREIGQAVGLTNVNAVRGHLAALEKKGYISKDPDKARSIRVLIGPSAMSRFKRRLHQLARTDEGVIHKVVYALAWCTWGRGRFLVGAARQHLLDAVEREAIERGWTLRETTVAPDHVAVVMEAWPNHSPELIVRRLKSAGRAARRRRPGDFPDHDLWQEGYAVTTEPELMGQLVAQLLGEPAPKGGS